MVIKRSLLEDAEIKRRSQYGQTRRANYILAPDVAQAFAIEKAVNDALRLLIKLAQSQDTFSVRANGHSPLQKILESAQAKLLNLVDSKITST